MRTLGPLSRPTTLLLVEDDPGITSMLTRHLQRAGLVVHTARTEQEGLDRIHERLPDVAVVDLNLPQGDGASLCSRIRLEAATRDLPLVVLTGRDDLEMKLDLYRRGADDYVVKPCAPEELLARIGALLRRGEGGPTLAHIGPLTIALRSGDAWLDETRLELTAGERGVLAELARSWPALARREALERARSRPDRPVSANVLEVILGRLRHKLRAAGGGVEIRTVRGIGYLLEISVATKEKVT